MKLATLIALLLGTFQLCAARSPPIPGMGRTEYEVGSVETEFNFTLDEPPTTALEPRAPGFDKKFWDAMQQKGCQLIAAMASKEGVDSTWTDPADLAAWGYGEDSLRDPAWHWVGMAPMLEEALGPAGYNTKKDHEGGLNQCAAVVHSEKTTQDKVEYLYKQLGGSGLPKIIASASVVNAKSGKLLAAALTPAESRNKAASQFDVRAECKNLQWDKRKYFAMTTDEGKALLASENGRGAALLLIQHKKEFGLTSTIQGVTVWCSKLRGDLNFMFETKYFNE